MSGLPVEDQIKSQNGIIDCELNKFTKTNGKRSIRVSGKELAIGVDYDRIDATYPSNIKEIYTYSKDGDSVLVIEVNYVTSAKRDVSSVVTL